MCVCVLQRESRRMPEHQPCVRSCVCVLRWHPCREEGKCDRVCVCVCVCAYTAKQVSQSVREIVESVCVCANVRERPLWCTLNNAYSSARGHLMDALSCHHPAMPGLLLKRTGESSSHQLRGGSLPPFPFPLLPPPPLSISLSPSLVRFLFSFPAFFSLSLLFLILK